MELSSSHTYILPTNQSALRVLAPALDLVRLGVLPWVVKLAPVGVERLGSSATISQRRAASMARAIT